MQRKRGRKNAPLSELLIIIGLIHDNSKERREWGSSKGEVHEIRYSCCAIAEI